MSPDTPVPAEERQVNLVLALRNTRVGLSTEEILRTVYGYDPEAEVASRRMLERDKETLRELGIAITVTDGPAGARYRVEDSGYELPEISLSSAQVAALDLAASAWRDGTLPVAARHALTKLRAVTSQGAEPDALPDLSVDLPGQEISSVLVRAVQDRQRVTFTYASASADAPRERTVEPHLLRLEEGAWYLDALDLDSQQPRTFRLARVVGEVRAVGEAQAFEVTALSEPGPTRAVLAVAPGRALALRARALAHDEALPSGLAEQGWETLAVEYVDPFGFAGSLAALADAVLVLCPFSLRDQVLSHLRGAAGLGPGDKAHGASPQEGE